MISKKTFSIVVALILGVGITTSALVTSKFVAPNQHRSDAAWAFVATNFGELVQEADVIALVETGASRTSRVVVTGEGASKNRLPFELVDMTVSYAVKGVQTGESITIERAGGLDMSTGEVVSVDIDGGSFDQYQQYFVFLKKQPGTDYYYVINDQGRFKLDGLYLHAVNHLDEVASVIDGQLLSDVLEMF